MKLLTRKSIHDYLDDGSMRIDNFSIEQLTPTNYYFRLGNFRLATSQNTPSPFRKGAELVLPPHGYATLTTLERFTIPQHIMCLLSQISDLPQLGLRLNHSMAIDPGFSGALEMALQNCLDKEITLSQGHSLGKIYFYAIPEIHEEENLDDPRLTRKSKRRETLEEPDIPGRLQWS